MISSKELRLKIQTINGDVLEIKTNNTCTVFNLKEIISNKINTPIIRLRLIFQGKVLKDNEGLYNYHIEDNDVLHLVIHTGSLHSNSRRNENDYNSNDIFSFIRLISTTNNYLNSFENNRINLYQRLEEFERNLNTTNQNSRLRISESFIHLLNPSNFDYYSSYENISQNIYNIKSILSNESNKKTLFTISNRLNKTSINFQLGQWVDVLDIHSNWTEAQIQQINTNTNKAFFHYIGTSSLEDEWINLDSPRIAIFRTHTVQFPFNRYYSPFPNTNDNNNSLLRLEKCDEPLLNLFEISEFIDNIKDKIQTIKDGNTKINEIKKENNSNIKQKENEEKKLYLNIMKLYPIMDRVGRLMLDYSMFLMNLSFKYFSDNYSMFKNDLVRENINEYSISERNNYQKRKLFQFEQFTQLGVMRNNGEVAETYRLIDPNISNIFTNNQLDRMNVPVLQQREHNGIINQTSGNRNELRIDYLNAITIIPNNVRKAFINNENNKVVQLNNFSYFHYNKKRIIMFDTFTQTYPVSPKYIINNNVSSIEYTSHKTNNQSTMKISTPVVKQSNRISIDASSTSTRKSKVLNTTKTKFKLLK